MNQSTDFSKTITVTKVFPRLGGGAVFFGKDAGGNSDHFLADHNKLSCLPYEGEVWIVRGTVEQHPKYGVQVRVENALRTEPSGSLIIGYLANSRAFKGVGIGIKKAQRLWDQFGESLYEILTASDISRLTVVLTEETSLKLVKAWKDTTESAHVIKFLSNHRFDLRLANKVRRIWPENTVQKLQNNPYRMLAFSSWSKVDAAAYSLGIGKDDPRRQVAAVEAYLYQRLDAKHTVTPKDAVINGVSVTLGGKDISSAEAAINLALREHAIVSYKSGFQPLGAAVMEEAIVTRFQAMIVGIPNEQPNLFARSLHGIAAEAMRNFEKEHSVSLNAEQRSGVYMALDSPLSVLTGGAGVGKTTVLKVIHEIYTQTGTGVIQMALSGRAAQRMREATGRQASTIAKFLRVAQEGKIDRWSAPFVIIDEASMLDLPLMYSIIRALPEKARLLFVGDPYQLPPIGFGLIFQILAGSPNVPRVELVQIHRQTESSGIPHVARNIRLGILPLLPSFAGVTSGMSFIESGSEGIMECIDAVMSQMRGCDDVQILGVTRRGKSGVSNINATFHKIYSDSREKLKSWEFAEGEPIIHLVNDYKRELWNGTLGRIETIRSNIPDLGAGHIKQSLICDFEGERHELLEEDFNRIDLAYAITVHKAQGSQFKRVVVPIVKSRLLDRTLVYTALTRGIEQVVFIGDRSAFEQAVKAQPKSQERMVGFSI